MKIKLEMEVKDCKDCPLYYFSEYSPHECYDGTKETQLEKFEGMIMQEDKLPCEIRPCPLEVKE